MFLFGHLGIGPRLLGPLRKRLPVLPLLFGCLLPDLIDKPVFYGVLVLRLHRVHAVIRGTRSFGHTLLFLLLLAGVAAVARKRALWAVALGVLTHFALDVGGEIAGSADPDSSIWLALLWPLQGVRFPRAHFETLEEHLQMTLQSAYYLLGEGVGLVLLLHDRLPPRRRLRRDGQSP